MNKHVPEPESISGIELAGSFYHEAVAPIIAAEYPDLKYSAALIGMGSEVLGFDDAMSRDHHWGPGVMLFLDPQDFEEHHGDIRGLLSNRLPHSFRGYPTNYAEPTPDDPGVRKLAATTSGPVNHRVDMYTIADFIDEYLAVRDAANIEWAEWLTLPQQKLRSICAGAVFRDEVGLETLRAQLAWYPRDVWLYMLAAGWQRIGQEEHLMGRAGHVGDEVGSALIGARLVRDLMRLVFLVERVYAPYPKWFGTAFARLRAAGSLQPFLSDALRAESWQEREAALCPAYRIVAQMHNDLVLTEPLPVDPSPFWGRPFRVIHGNRFVEALCGAIEDPALRALCRTRPLGNIDQITDNTDLLEDPLAGRALREVYLDPHNLS